MVGEVLAYVQGSGLKVNATSMCRFYHSPITRAEGAFMKDETKKENKPARFHLFAWWKLSQDELEDQIRNYETLKFYKTARGISIGCLLFSSIATFLLFNYTNMEMGSASDYAWDAGIVALLCVFIAKGRRWAMITAMVYWTLCKALSIYTLIESGYSGAAFWGNFFWWTAYMQVFWLSYKIEAERKKRLNSAISL